MALSVAQAVPEHYQREFEINWGHTVQQQIQRLGNMVRVDNFTGKEKVYTDLEEMSWTQRSGRLTQSTPDEITAHKRKLTKLDFKCQVIFDRTDDDFLGELGRPDGEVQESMAMAWNRAVDARTADAADATVYGGAEPYTTAIDLPSSQQVAVNYVSSGSAVNSGMTPQKVIQAKKLFADQDIYPEEEELCLVIGPDEEQDLLLYVESGTNDVWASMIAAWLEGKSNTLFGFNVKVSTQLNVASNIATCFAYSKRRGIVVAPSEMEVSIDRRPDLDHAIQISAYAKYGFMRRYEETVVTIASSRA